MQDSPTLSPEQQRFVESVGLTGGRQIGTMNTLTEDVAA